MRDQRWRVKGRYRNRIAPETMNERSGTSATTDGVAVPAATRLEILLRCHFNYFANEVPSHCVWEALAVSGRGTAPAKPALCLGVVDD